MEDLSKFARPYAVAAFNFASESKSIDAWSDALALLTTVSRDPNLSGLIANPRAQKDQVAALIIDVCGDGLDDGAKNLVRVLAENGKLSLVPEIAASFEAQRSAQENRSTVEVVSAYELSKAEQKTIASAVQARIGGTVELSTTVDESLIGGVIVKSGDLVIDMSMRGQLKQLERAIG